MKLIPHDYSRCTGKNFKDDLVCQQKATCKRYLQGEADLVIGKKDAETTPLLLDDGTCYSKIEVDA